MNNTVTHPSWHRYKKLFLNTKENLSVLRTLQYEMLTGASLGKKILDFGGGNKAKYRHLILCESYESINIDPSIRPTWTTQVRESFPTLSNHYDTVLSLNVLEHIYDVHFVLKEIHRTLKPEGNILFSTPFLFPIHAHPNDYFRPTDSWIEQALFDNGFKNIKITPLAWGPFSTGLTCSRLSSKKMFAHSSLIMDLLYLNLRKIIKKKSTNENLSHLPLGYFVEAFKNTEKIRP